jgi:single-strand DNA-binding protein
MSGVNKTILVGNVGKKPERRVTTSGQVVCNFSICVNERLGKEREKATWFNIVTFGNQAEACAQYLDKGRQVYVEGRIDVRTVEKDGVRRTFTDIVAHDIQFLSAPTPKQESRPEQRPAPHDYEADPFGPLPSLASQEDLPF